MFASVIFCIIQQRLAALFSFHLLHPQEITLQQCLFRYKFPHPVLFQIQLRGPCEHHPVLKLVPSQEAVIIHSHFIVDFLLQNLHGLLSQIIVGPRVFPHTGARQGEGDIPRSRHDTPLGRGVVSCSRQL